MATQTLLNPQAAASNNEGSLFLKTDDFDNIMVFATGLGAAESVSIFVTGGAVDITYSVAGTPLALTQAQPHASLPPGPTYRLSKGVTAAPVGIYAATDA